MEAFPLRGVGHDERLTIVEHLSELRARLVLSGAALGVVRYMSLAEPGAPGGPERSAGPPPNKRFGAGLRCRPSRGARAYGIGLRPACARLLAASA